MGEEEDDFPTSPNSVTLPPKTLPPNPRPTRSLPSSPHSIISLPHSPHPLGRPVDRFPEQSNNRAKHMSTSTITSSSTYIDSRRSSQQVQAYSGKFSLPSSPREHQRTSSGSYLSGATMLSPTQPQMDSPDLLISPTSPTTETKPAGFFKRLRSKFRRRSLSPQTQPPNTENSDITGLNVQQSIAEKEQPTHETEHSSPVEEPSSASTSAKPSSLNPFKRKKKDEEWTYYEAVEHWTDDW